MLGRRAFPAGLKGRLSFFRNPDRVSGLVLAGLALFAIYEARHLPFGSIWAPDAGFFPLTLSVLLLLVALIIVLMSFLTKPLQVEFTARSHYVAGAAVALVVYAFVLPTMGFVASTVSILLLLMRGFGQMSWTRALIITIPAVFLSYFGFLELGVPLPRGILPF